jgi:predicted adenine nucleotide alpha hydrolase (AANH) superfamily ATPase
MKPNIQNFQKHLDETIRRHVERGERPRLLLHACCAPCSSYVLEYLSQYFRLSVFDYNPNISPASEFRMRTEEIERLVKEMPFPRECPDVIVGKYDPERFYEAVKGHESDREGGDRCAICFRLRLREAAEAAKAGGYDYFTTTLSISPLKNAALLNMIGAELAEEYGVPYLYSDFKKRNGYKRSIELSREYGLYRQDYCGCVFSKREREIGGSAP